MIRAARENGYLNKKWAVVITGTPNFADARANLARYNTKTSALNP